MTVETAFYKYENCYPIVNRYSIGDGLAIQIWNDEDGAILNLTVNLPDNGIPPEYDEQYVNTNNFPGAMKLIKKYKLGVPTGIYGISGFCRYPLVKFDLHRLAELQEKKGAE